jgi:hypothetical protein
MRVIFKHDSVFQRQGHRKHMEPGTHTAIGTNRSGKRFAQTVHDQQSSIAEGFANVAGK